MKPKLNWRDRVAWLLCSAGLIVAQPNTPSLAQQPDAGKSGNTGSSVSAAESKTGVENSVLKVSNSSSFPLRFSPTNWRRAIRTRLQKVVKSVNGIPIRNLGHLVEVLRDARGELVTIAFASHDRETMAFPRAQMLAATEEILTDNGIRS
jgi:hypothetical protein